MQSEKLKILCLEDLETDAIIIREQLRRDGLNFQFDLVSTEQEFTHKLKSEKYDIIFSDYTLPGFSGVAALILSKKLCPDVPFICISGTIGEDLAVELMHIGASDYIMKDKLSKLSVSIERALTEVRERQARIEAEVSRRESELRFRDIIMCSYDWVWEIDRNWKYCYTSDTIKDILGYSSEEVIGKSPFDFMPDDEKEIVGPVFSGIVEEKGIIKDLENWNLRKDGQRVCLLTNGFPIFDETGNLIGYRGVDKDITKSKNLNIELIRAKEKAEESNRLKTAFLQNMSHEIRTPLNGILGFVELLKNATLASEKRNEYIEIVEKSGWRLLTTINDIIEISEIESGTVEVKLEEENIKDILQNHYNFFNPEIQKKGLSFNISYQPDFKSNQVLIDRYKLDSIFINLINNAIKFTEQGSIEIGCYRDSNYLVFYVRDTGIGIPADKQEAIFERFVQADLTNTRGYEGSGLGLSISKAYSDLLGGKIWVDSVQNTGSTFYFSIPYKTQNKDLTADSEENDIQVRFHSAFKILIVEDDAPSFMFLESILSEYGLVPVHAVNGAEAIIALKNNPDIELILMDLEMPVLDGLEATRKIRKFEKSIPIIAQTAYAFSSDKEKALEAGCNDYISKPINESTLIRMIQQHIKNT